MLEIISTLFLERDRLYCISCELEVQILEELLFTHKELTTVGGSLKNGKAPDPDGILIEAIRAIIQVYPELLFRTFDGCLKEGRFLW